MRVLRDAWRDWESAQSMALAVGVFDGVHRGHQAVLSACASRADAARLQTGVVTFDRHPLTVLAPEHAPKMLSTLEQRVELLGRHGADLVAVLPFDDAMRAMPPSAFVEEILVERLNAALVVVGRDFRFGRDRGGDPALLEALADRLGYEVAILDLVGDGDAISSTRIRKQLAAGDVAEASEMLGRPYRLSGLVVAGAGRSLVTGAPTANVDVSHDVALPRRGVYAVFAGTGDMHQAVANVGVRPTFGGGAESVEVHLLDTQVDVGGELLQIDFIERIRAEAAFFDADALATQIEEDIGTARRMLAGRTP